MQLGALKMPPLKNYLINHYLFQDLCRPFMSSCLAHCIGCPSDKLLQLGVLQKRRFMLWMNVLSSCWNWSNSLIFLVLKIPLCCLQILSTMIIKLASIGRNPVPLRVCVTFKWRKTMFGRICRIVLFKFVMWMVNLFTKEMRDTSHFVELRDLMLHPCLSVWYSFQKGGFI